MKKKLLAKLAKRNRIITNRLCNSNLIIERERENIDNAKKEEQSNALWDELTHNLVDLNAKAMFGLANLVPDDIIATNTKELVNSIIDYIKEDFEKTALTIFRTKRYLLGMKAEFSVVEKLVKARPLTLQQINVRNIVVGVVHLFYEEINVKNLTFDIKEWFDKSYIDYETIQVALYYIIGNAIKYTKNSTKITVDFKIDNNMTNVSFEMTSLYISDEDILNIFQKERYSGEMAKKAKLQGKGIGMYRAKKLIERNQGKIEITPGEQTLIENSLSYANNLFLIKIPCAR